jgi:predicted transcriptional regulator
MHGAYARNTDPDTSHIAAANVNINHREAEVLRCIKISGFMGATRDEIALMAGMETTKDTISPRMVPLLKKGLIKRYRKGRKYFKRRGVTTGNVQIVNFATEFYDLERFL